METVVRTDLEHKHLADIHEQSDGSLIARCVVCGDSWHIRRKADVEKRTGAGG